MSLIISFVSFLNNEERKLFSVLPLLGKEKMLRDVVLIRDPATISKEGIMKELNISSVHYDKINNRILKKSYQFIAGADELEQLNFLSKKFMFNHLFHEIKNRKPKVIRGEMSDEKRERFMRAFFDFSINVPAKYFNEKFVLQNSKDYLEIVKENKRAREFEVKSKLLFARMNSLIQKGVSEALAVKMRKEITALEKKYNDVNEPEIKSILYHAWINYYRVLTPNWKKRTNYLKKIEELYADKKMPVFERAISECHHAEMLYEQSQFSKAHLAYAKAFSLYMPILLNQFHHFARWIELSIILGLYSEAEHLLDTLFKVYVLNRHESNGVLGSLLYAELYLIKEEYQKAFHYISLAKSLNSVQVYINYEIRIRMLEALYFSVTGESVFVSKLVQRTIRYIQLQKLTSKKYKYIQFMRILKDYKNMKASFPYKLDNKSKALMADFEKGYEKLNELLLKKLLNRPS